MIIFEIQNLDVDESENENALKKLLVCPSLFNNAQNTISTNFEVNFLEVGHRGGGRLNLS